MHKRTTSCGEWSVLISSLFDWDGKQGHELPGHDVTEWLSLVMLDYDHVDRMYIDSETIGG